jgi:hypothetical protein
MTSVDDLSEWKHLTHQVSEYDPPVGFLLPMILKDPSKYTFGSVLEVVQSDSYREQVV